VGNLDLGEFAARVAQARLKEAQTEGTVATTRREPRPGSQRAQSDLANLHHAIQIRARAVLTARDSYVLAEGRSGAAAALYRLDAYAALEDAEVAGAAEAQARR